MNKMREHFNKLEKIAVKSVHQPSTLSVPSLKLQTDWDLYLFLLLTPTFKLVLLIRHYIAIRNIHSKFYPLSSI